MVHLNHIINNIKDVFTSWKSSTSLSLLQSVFEGN